MTDRKRGFCSNSRAEPGSIKRRHFQDFRGLHRGGARGVVEDSKLAEELSGKQFGQDLGRVAATAQGQRSSSNDEVYPVAGLSFMEHVLSGDEMLDRVASADTKIS